MVFRSANAARTCAADLRAVASDSQSRVLQTVQFVMPLESNWGTSATHWANFTAVLFPGDLKKQAMAFWRDTGAGLSTRHATYCLEELDYLDSDSSEPTFRTPALQKRSRRQSQQSVMLTQSADSSMDEIKTFLAQLATSEQPGQPAVDPDDVFLYPNGMNAIYALSEGVASFAADSTVAAYGYDRLHFLPQNPTVHNSNACPPGGFIRRRLTSSNGVRGGNCSLSRTAPKRSWTS